MLQLIKEALGQNGVTPRDDSPVTEVLNQVCPSSWRGACKTAVQLLFAQAGLVSRNAADQGGHYKTVSLKEMRMDFYDFNSFHLPYRLCQNKIKVRITAGSIWCY